VKQPKFTAVATRLAGAQDATRNCVFSQIGKLAVAIPGMLAAVLVFDRQ
jgi:hypothetical protein